MKPRHYIALALTLVGVALVVAMLLLPRPLPPDECSDVYRQYKDTPGIKASFIKDYPINDTLAVDVTMLQAKDTNVWNNTIIKLFHIENPDEYIPRQITFLLIPKNADRDPEDKTLLDHDLIAGDKKELTIGLFHLENEKQYDAIFETYFKNLIK
jgi:hypothetical protein